MPTKGFVLALVLTFAFNCWAGMRADGIALMSALDVNASKYGIVYKGKELIIEPMNLSNSTVSAAYDCTYKEFNSIEEAQLFIKSNGLKKVESM